MNRGSIVGGVILILVGLFFLLLPLFPNVSANLDIEQHWPLIIVAIGGLFLLGALIGAPGLAVPGSIIAGLGLLMYYQNANDAWDTWAFAWTLIPGFVGVGTILHQTLKGNFRQGLRDGGRLIVISLVMFIIFGSILGEFGTLSFAWAVGLIALGLWILARNLLRERKTEKEKSVEDQVIDS